MNYTVVVVVAYAIFACLYWVIWARHTFTVRNNYCRCVTCSVVPTIEFVFIPELDLCVQQHTLVLMLL